MTTLYDAIGGEPTFRRIVARFYAEVAVDEILRALYPERDLAGAEERLWDYLETTAQHMVNSPVEISTALGDRAGPDCPRPYASRHMASVRLRGQLEKLAGGGPEHEIEGDTVDELLQGLESTFSALEGWILDERGVLRQHINVFVNGEPADPGSPVGASDKIEILPAISGG